MPVDTETAALDVLEHGECWKLIASMSIGRLALVVVEGGARVVTVY
jgi:hypothetical protein